MNMRLPQVRKESKTAMRIGIIGGGKVGTCLAGYLKPYLAGITANSETHSRQLATAFSTEYCTNVQLVQNADVLLVTVPDRLISAVSENLAQEADVNGKIFLHCSGSLGLEVLTDLAAKSAHAGSLHPLQSFAGGKTNLQGVYMALDGDEQAKKAAEKIAALLGGHPFHVPAAERAAYHAAACICSNYAVTVEALAQSLMRRWLGDEQAAWQALLPLFNGTAYNLHNTKSPRTVLTGPIARGDANTVAKHLAVLPAELTDVYCSLGLATTELALTNGTIDNAAAQNLTRLLQQKKLSEV